MDLYVFGITPFAEMLRYYIEESSDDCFCAYIVDEQYRPKDGMLGGATVLTWEEFITHVDHNSCEVLSSVTYGGMNSLRTSVYERIKKAGYKCANYIHPSALISKNCKIGEGNIFLENVVIQPFVQMQNNNVFWSNSCICHHTCMGSYNFFAAGSVVLGQVEIGDQCFFGANSTVKNKTRISSKSLIGASGFVSSDTEERAVIVPARSLLLEKKSNEVLID